MKIRGAAVVALLLVCGLAQGEKKSVPGKWVGTWACAPIAQGKGDKTAYANTTVRDVVACESWRRDGAVSDFESVWGDVAGGGAGACGG